MPPSKRLKKSHSSLPKPDELEELRDIESLFHSSLFKLQVDELFEELNVEVIPDEWIEKFQDFLKNISETRPYSIDEFPLGSVKLPLFKKKNVKGVLKFSPPEKIHTLGSFVLKTLCSSTPYVLDMAVEIPKVCWQKMDFLNERYHRKRALYLAHVAVHLQEAEFIEDVKFSFQNDCHLKPVLVIVPKGITDRVISLTAYPNESAFKLTRFIPSRNNVRCSWLLGKAEEDKLEVPTPYYNATILADLLLPRLNDYLKENLTQENVRKGLVLVKLWLIQRGLMSGHGRLSGFVISMFVVHLLKKQKINAFMNPYQVFRCTLLAFQHENFEGGISLAEDGADKPALEEFKMFPGIFLDESGFLNMLHSVNKETLDMLKHEAKLGLNILDNEMTNCFTLLFMKKITPLEKYEYLIHLNGAKKFRKYSANVTDTSDNLNFGENKIGAAIPRICNILRKGLNERILLIDVVKNSPSPWSVYESPPSPNCGQVTIGLLLNPEVPLSNIEKGPLADDPQAKEFRKFWGNQSEMRRFQDGSIREAVYWPANTFEDRRRVFCQMVKDILKRHLKGKENEFVVSGTDVDSILHLPENSLPPETKQYGTGEEAHVSVMDSFNSLSKLLRKLEGLPLQISSIQGISPSFHFSEVFPPLPAHCSANDPAYINVGSVLKMKKNAHLVPPFTPALNVVIEFEGSGKWPDDLEAIKRVKAAFFIKIAELVKSKYSLIAVPFLTHTDLVKDGYVFRIVIASHKELHLMKTHVLPNGAIKLQDTDESQQLELLIKVKPRLNSLLHGIQQQHFTYGTACRLAKRWMSAQLKHGYIHSTAVELLVAHLYIHPDPYTCPSSPQTAFIRFLSLIVNHDWKSSPIIVNLNNELQRNEIEEIYSTFTAERSTLPPMVIATPFDKRGTLWTKNKPHSLILKRIIILARASLDTLQNMLFSMKEFDVKCIFRPPLEAFDVIIHLNHHAVPKLKYAVDIHEMNELPNLKSCERKDKVYPIVEFDPPRKYYEELKANFEDFAFFFYDVYGGDFIGVIWKKSAFATKEFKTSHVNCRQLKEDALAANTESILEDFYTLGTGLVKFIKK